MKKKFGFSLAEALLTLLIVCIIAIASAPIITKKNRQQSESITWSQVKRGAQSYIHPSGNKDIMLGSPKSQKGIVVNGILVFKNTKGETIGWIAEDGTSSFAQGQSQGMGLDQISPQQMDKMVKAVTDSMKRQNIQMQPPAQVIQTPQAMPAAAPVSTSQYDNNADMNKQLNEMGKGMNIDLGALLKGLQ